MFIRRTFIGNIHPEPSILLTLYEDDEEHNDDDDDDSVCVCVESVHTTECILCVSLVC